MKLPGHIAKRVRALLEEVGSDIEDLFPRRLEEEAGKLLPYFQGTRRKPPSKLPKSLQSRRPAKAKIHKENTRALRAAVMERSKQIWDEPSCELCSKGGPLEMHHLEGGSGRRREKQAVSNCIALCSMCHKYYHANPGAYAGQVCAWADRYGYAAPVGLRGTRLKAAPESVNSPAIKDTQS